ncbi:MAG: FAD-dependent thymidylate synthase, partial [Patescibacteria group bacterium]
YEKIRRHLGADVAQYVVLFGFKARWIMGMNDREALHMWELRTTKQGHPDYRRVCQKMHALLKQISPLRAEMMSNVDHNDYFWSRAESEARQRRKETALGIEVLEE